MAAPVVVFRGLAAVEGVAGTFDAILYAVTQTIKVTQNFEEEVIKDVHGYDAAWLYRNENAEGDWMLKLMGDTAAHAAAPAQAVSTTAIISSLGQPFSAPGTVATLSTFTLTALNGVWQLRSGGDFDLANTKAGELTFKARKYANSNQETAIANIPA
jgi:hypothetical protein